MALIIKRRGTQQEDAQPVQAAEELPSLYRQLRGALIIDKDRLEEAVLRQPDLFFQVAEQYSLAVSRRDAARDNLSRMDAEIARNIRADLAKRNEKDTASVVTDLIILDARHIQAAEQFAKLKQASDEWGTLKESYEQRMRMLRELVSLYSTGYWTNAGAGRTNATVRNALADQARERMEEKRQEQQRGRG